MNFVCSDNSPVEDLTVLDSLPNEILMLIFELIPYRFELAAVCKKFYKIVVLLEKLKFKLSVTDENILLDYVTFSSIINSSRSFNSLSLNVTTKFNHMCWERLQRIINFINFESISIISTDCRHSTNVSIAQFLSANPPNGLSELSLVNVDLVQLRSFFKSQKAIKSLAITGSVPCHDIFQQLDLRRLKLIGPKSNQLRNILLSHTNLTSLKLTIDSQTDYNFGVFEAICSLENIEELDVPFGKLLETQSVILLSTLTNLKKLSLNFTVLSFSLFTVVVRLPTITELDATIDDAIPQDSIQELAQSMPNVTKIKLKAPMMTNFLRDFSQYFPKLESLWIENEESYFINVIHPPTIESHKGKLKHLAIVNNSRKFVIFPNEYLLKFLETCPKLQTLVILRYIDIQAKNLRNILISLPNLEEIVIEASSMNSTTGTMTILKEFGSHLKLIKLENLMTYCDSENLKTFFDGVFPIIEKKDKSLILRKIEQFHLQKLLS